VFHTPRGFLLVSSWLPLQIDNDNYLTSLIHIVMGLFSKLFKREGHKARPITNDFDSLYFLGRKLGQGAFAVVRECTRKSDSMKFAVKVITKAKLQGEFDAVINEIDILKKINHPNIISLVEMYQTDEHYYLVMVLATGGELFERILAKGSYTEADAATLVKQLIKALIYLHDEVDIVHRDLKPENLLFRDSREDADLMVTDFGLSKNIHGDLLSTTCGSPHYVAPEVLKGTGHGKPVDMWALGVITFVLLCGCN
jgi:calcium/calmodulin-dependent protein kinase I